MTETKKSILSKDIIFVQLIPLVWGIITWTDVKYSAVRWLQGTIPPGVYSSLLHPQVLWPTLLLVLILYGALTKVLYGWANLVTYFLKLILFPLYLILQIIFSIFSVGEGIYLLISAIWKILSSSVIIVLITVLSIFCYFILTLGNLKSLTATIALGLSPILAVVAVGWLYAWTFNPLAFTIVSIRKLLKLYLSINLLGNYKKITQANTEEELIASIPREKRKKVLQLLDEPINKLSLFYSIVSKLNIKTVLTHVFAFGFLYITTLVTVDFAQYFYSITTVYPGTVSVSKGVSFLDYIFFSLRTLLLNDYGPISPEYYTFKLVVLLESAMGLALFTLLVTSFSTISADKGEEKKNIFYNEVLFIIEKLKNTKFTLENSDGKQE